MRFFVAIVMCVTGVAIIGLFARLTDAVGGGLCYHNECCQGLYLEVRAGNLMHSKSCTDIDVLPFWISGERPHL
jgi:hypothetical protein